VTEAAIDQPEAATDMPRKKAWVVERPRFPLVLKLFGLMALLIILVVGIAVGITIQRANAVAQETVQASITSAARLFRELEEQRLARVELPTALLGNDPSFAAAIAADLGVGGEAAPTPIETPLAASDAPAGAPVTDTAAPPDISIISIADQLEQRREAFRTDLLLLLDDQGRLIHRTDRPPTATPPMTDLYDQTVLVRQAIDDSLPSFRGTLLLDGKLYHAAIAPVGLGTPRIVSSYLVNAVDIGDKFANSIADSTKAGVIFSTKDASTTIRSSNAPSVPAKQIGTGKTSEVTVDQSRYIATSETLRSGNDVVGSALFLRSLDRELAPFHEIERALLAGGGGALLLAFILSWFIAKRVTRPIEQLAGIAQAVTAGDYEVEPDVRRNDEVGILGRAFGKMINSLRDKAELEELYSQMADRAVQDAPRAAAPARVDEGTLLVTDLRGLPATAEDGEADGVMMFIDHAMRIQQAEVARQEGEVREISGHRLTAVFRGDRGVIHAIRAARAMNEELASQIATPMTIGVGIATGQFVTGSVPFGKENTAAIVGNAPLLALIFAWHAPNGHAYVSHESAQSAGSEVLSNAQKDEVRLKWLAQPLPVLSLPLLSVTTGMMRSLGSTLATIKLGGDVVPSGVQADLQIGHLFAGRYRIEQILGRGGMGVVYKALDTQLDEVLAIKTLPGDVMTRSPEDLERFKREIRLARKITHRNVLRTYDYGESEGVYFISMEFVRGYTLSDLLEEAPLRRMSARAAVGIARQICRGLQAAHEQGIIHRDIKPQNVLIDAKGEVKLMDFGIARMAESPEGVTQAGFILGTPHYMSPEQVQGAQIDSRSDIYSMGVLIYEMLAGKRPFESPSLTAVLTAHLLEKPDPLIEVRPDAGRALSTTVMRCMEKEPGSRYADAGALLADLDAMQFRSAAA
jgi:eukaryotic-like serine/threonine-protein kinase